MADRTFDGDTSADWLIGTNWDNNALPGSSDKAILDGAVYNGAVTCGITGNSDSVDGVQINSNYTGTFTVNFDLESIYGDGLKAEYWTLNGKTIHGTGVCSWRDQTNGSTRTLDAGSGAVIYPTFQTLCGNGGQTHVYSGTMTFKGAFTMRPGGLNTKYYDFDTNNPSLTFEGDVLMELNDGSDYHDRVEVTWGTTTITFTGTNNQTVDGFSKRSGHQTLPATTINKSSGWVKFTQDLELASLTCTAGELDLNGQTISVAGAITVAAGFTITDSVGGGSLKPLAGWDINGSSGNNVEIDDADFDLTDAEYVNADYVTISNSTVTAGRIYATNSTDNGGNTNWSIGTRYQFKVLNDLTPADATDHDITETGFGTPDGAVVLISGASPGTNPRADAIISIGFMDGTDDIGWGIGTEDGPTTTNSGRRHDNAGIGRVFYGETGGGGSGSTTEADWDASFITDGIRLSIATDNTTTEYRVTVWLFKGVKNVKALFTADQTINFGFRPSLVLAGTIGQGVSVGNTVHGYMSFGAIHIDSNDTVTQGCVSWGDASRKTTAVAFSDSSNSEFAVYGGPYGNIWTANCTGLNGSVGITVNNYDADDRILYLAIECEDHDDAAIGWFQSATAADGEVTVSGIGIRPAAFAFVSTMNDTLNDLETASDLGVAVGVSDGVKESSVYWAVNDAFSGGDAECGYDDDAIGLHCPFNSTDETFTLSSIDSTGFKVKYSEAESTQYYNFYIAINDGGIPSTGFTGTGAAGSAAGSGQAGILTATSPDFTGTGLAGTATGSGQAGIGVFGADQYVFPGASNSGNEWDTLAQAITAASSGDVIQISGSWSSADSSSTQIDLASKDLTIRAVGTAKWTPTSTNNYRLEYTGAGTGRALSIQSMGANDEMTIEGIEIIHDATGTSSEVVRWECYQGETLNLKGCYLHSTQSTSDSDLFYINGGAGNAPNGTINIEQCVFYNAYRCGINHQMFAAQSASTTLTVNINSCLFYKCGINDYQAGAIVVAYGSAGSGGDNYYSNWNIQNCLIHSQEKAVVAYAGGVNTRASGTDRGETQHTIRVGNCLVYDQHDFGGSTVDTGDGDDVDSFANSQKDVTFMDTTPTGTGYEAYFESLSGTLDFRLKDHADNDAINYHNDAEIYGVTIPSADIIGTSRPQDTNYDVGPFEIVSGTPFTGTGVNGSVAGTGQAGTIAADFVGSGVADTAAGTGQAGVHSSDFIGTGTNESVAVTGQSGDISLGWNDIDGTLEDYVAVDGWVGALTNTTIIDFTGTGSEQAAAVTGQVGTLSTSFVGEAVAGTGAGAGQVGQLANDYRSLIVLHQPAGYWTLSDVHPSSIDDTFTGTNGDAVDESLWRNYDDGNGVGTKEIQGNAMRVTLDVDTTSPAVYGVSSQHLLSGDFEVEVEFKNLDFTGSGNKYALLLTAFHYESPYNEAYAGAHETGLANSYFVGMAADGSASLSGRINTFGSLRIKRTGAVITCESKDGLTNWVTLDTAGTRPTSPCYIVLRAQCNTDNTTATVDFDNFTVVSGTISPFYVHSEVSGDGIRYGIPTEENALIKENGVAMGFDGSSQWARLGFASATGGQGSVEFWCQPGSTVTSWSTLVASCDTASTNYFFNIGLTNTGKLNINLRENGTDLVILYGQQTFAADTVYHVVVTSDGSTIKAYINGTEETLSLISGTNSGQWFDDVTSRDTLSIAALERSSVVSHFDGVIDQVAIYDYALPLARVQNHYNYAPTSFVDTGAQEVVAGTGYAGTLTTSSSVNFTGTGVADAITVSGVAGDLVTGVGGEGSADSVSISGQAGTLTNTIRIDVGYDDWVLANADAEFNIDNWVQSAGIVIGNGIADFPNRAINRFIRYTMPYADDGLPYQVRYSFDSFAIGGGRPRLGDNYGTTVYAGGDYTDVLLYEGADYLFFYTTETSNTFALDYFNVRKVDQGTADAVAITGHNGSMAYGISPEGQEGTVAVTGNGGSVAFDLAGTGQEGTVAVQGHVGQLLTDFTGVGSELVANVTGQVGDLTLTTQIDFTGTGTATAVAITEHAGAISAGYVGAAFENSVAVTGQAGTGAFDWTGTGQQEAVSGTGQIGEISQLGFAPTGDEEVIAVTGHAADAKIGGGFVGTGTNAAVAVVGQVGDQVLGWADTGSEDVAAVTGYGGSVAFDMIPSAGQAETVAITGELGALLADFLDTGSEDAATVTGQVGDSIHGVGGGGTQDVIAVTGWAASLSTSDNVPFTGEGLATNGDTTGRAGSIRASYAVSSTAAGAAAETGQAGDVVLGWRNTGGSGSGTTLGHAASLNLGGNFYGTGGNQAVALTGQLGATKYDFSATGLEQGITVTGLLGTGAFDFLGTATESVTSVTGHAGVADLDASVILTGLAEAITVAGQQAALKIFIGVEELIEFDAALSRLFTVEATLTRADDFTATVRRSMLADATVTRENTDSASIIRQKTFGAEL